MNTFAHTIRQIKPEIEKRVILGEHKADYMQQRRLEEEWKGREAKARKKHFND